MSLVALIDQALANPSEFGFSNVTAPCYTGPFTGGGSACSDPDSHLFWDDVHPTAAGHLLVADDAAELIGVPIPEPSTWAMTILGVACLGAREGDAESGRPHRLAEAAKETAYAALDPRFRGDDSRRGAAGAALSSPDGRRSAARRG